MVCDVLCLLVASSYCLSANPDLRQRITNIRKLVHGLPKCNRDLLIVVSKFLNLIAEHEDVNKMSSLNLAVVNIYHEVSNSI